MVYRYHITVNGQRVGIRSFIGLELRVYTNYSHCDPDGQSKFLILLCG